MTAKHNLSFNILKHFFNFYHRSIRKNIFIILSGRAVYKQELNPSGFNFFLDWQIFQKSFLYRVKYLSIIFQSFCHHRCFVFQARVKPFSIICNHQICITLNHNKLRVVHFAHKKVNGIRRFRPCHSVISKYKYFFAPSFLNILHNCFNRFHISVNI